MDLPFPVKQGEPITASNTNRTIGAVRWAVNKIQSTFPRAIPKGTSYEAPFQVTVTEKDDGNTWYIEINEGWWLGRGHYPSKGCAPDYQINTESGDQTVPFPEITPYNDAFWIPSCKWEIGAPQGRGGNFREHAFFVFLADLSTDTGLVEEHPKPYLMTSPVTDDSPFASATCLVPVAFIEQRNACDEHGQTTHVAPRVVQLLASNAIYTAEYPLATQPFQFYRKSWTLNTFVCNGGLVRVRYPIGISKEIIANRDATTEEHTSGLGGADVSTEGATTTGTYQEAWYYIEGTEISVSQESTGSLISLVYTQAGNERGMGTWIVTDLAGIVPDADDAGGHDKDLYAQGAPIYVSYDAKLDISEYDNLGGLIGVTGYDFSSNMGEDFTVQIPVAIVRKQKGSDVLTCQQINAGVLTAEPQMQFNLRCSETLDNNGQTEISQYSGTGSSTLQSGEVGTPVTEQATATATRVDVARFKLEQEELDRANTISGEEIGTE